MKLNQITLAAFLMAVFAAPAVLAQGMSNTQPLSREAVRSEAISSHRDGTMSHSEAAPKSEPFKSTKARSGRPAGVHAQCRRSCDLHPI